MWPVLHGLGGHCPSPRDDNGGEKTRPQPGELFIGRSAPRHPAFATVLKVTKPALRLHAMPCL